MNAVSIPLQMIAAIDEPGLQSMLAYLNRTRSRSYSFSLNAKTVVTTRRWARDAVAAELATRSKEP